MTSSLAEQVMDKLQTFGELRPTIGSLIEIYQKSPELLYELALVKFGDSQVPEWTADLSILAGKVRSIVFRGFEIDEELRLVRSGPELVDFRDVTVGDLRQFLLELTGTGVLSASGRDYLGAEVSEGEVAFKTLSESEFEPLLKRYEQRQNAQPRLLRLSDEDKAAVTGGMPSYIAHALIHCAFRVVQAPTAVFQGIRGHGKLKKGYAYCGTPKCAFDNNGNEMPPNSNYVFMVYADDEGYVFDWDWVRADPQNLRHPANWQSRFEKQLSETTEAMLVGIDDVAAGSFTQSNAWYSSRGDCIFWYWSDELAYAERTNDDLTVFKSFDSHEKVGCKVKNVERLFSIYTEELSTKLLYILADSLRRQLINKASVGGYGGIISQAESLNPVLRGVKSKAAHG